MLAVAARGAAVRRLRARARGGLRQVHAVVGRSGRSDWLTSTAIGVVLAAAGAALFAALMRRFPRAVVGGRRRRRRVHRGPVRVAGAGRARPGLQRLPGPAAGRTRADVEQLARRAGVDVGEVLVVDASRRTTAANAYVDGLGHTKRVVLYDTLLERFTPEQVRLVVAHELGHVKHRDLARGMLWVAIVAPARCSS